MMLVEFATFTVYPYYWLW